jgi:hypothetical protein
VKLSVCELIARLGVEKVVALQFVDAIGGLTVLVEIEKSSLSDNT